MKNSRPSEQIVIGRGEDMNELSGFRMFGNVRRMEGQPEMAGIEGGEVDIVNDIT